MQIITQTTHWTYEDMVKNLPAESQYELRDFNLIEIPSPKPKHQRIVHKLVKLPDTFIEGKSIGELFLSPLDVVFQKGNVAQPDLIFIATDNKHIIKESHISGASDLLVEVVSKGSVARDYIEKRNDYQKFGVKEYWIIDSLNESIWVYTLSENAQYDLHSCAEETEVAKSKLFEGFEMAHELIFGE
jgi:Uma2 family endonuclease